GADPVDSVARGSGGAAAPPRLPRAQAGRRCWQGLRDLISLGLAARVLASLGTRARAALLGWMVPLIPAVLPGGKWAHPVSAAPRDGPRPWQGGRWEGRGADCRERSGAGGPSQGRMRAA